MRKLNITVLTIFPEMFPGPLGCSLAGRALKHELWSLDVINIRDFGITKHRKVDDTQVGGGSGLVMRPDVLGDALDYVLSKINNAKEIHGKKIELRIPIIYPSPRGRKFDQSTAKSLSCLNDIIILCGRFEGIDQRVIEEYHMQEISLGDYVLSGGEIAAYAIIDATLRMIPGVISNTDTLKEESFEEVLLHRFDEDEGRLKPSARLLEHPLYTKPSIWRQRSVPEVLLSGNHNAIEKWKYSESLKITKSNRPDLLMDAHIPKMSR